MQDAECRKSSLAFRSWHALLGSCTRHTPPTNRHCLTLLRRSSPRNFPRNIGKETGLLSTALLFLSRYLINCGRRSLLLRRSSSRHIWHLLPRFFAILLIGNLGLLLFNLILDIFLLLLKLHIPFNTNKDSVGPADRNTGHVHAIVLECVHKGTEICCRGSIVTTQRRQAT